MLETDENITKQSRSRPCVASCSNHAPWAFGAITVRSRSAVSAESGASSMTIARWKIALEHRGISETRRFTSFGEPMSAFSDLSSRCRGLRGFRTNSTASGVDAPLRLLSTR